MKKFIMMAVMAIVAISASAQDAGEYFVTPKINYGYATMSNDYKGGMLGGVGVEFEYMAADKFGISAGVEFNYFSGNTTSVTQYTDGITVSTEQFNTMGFLNIPILAQYHIGNLALKAGIQPGIVIAPKDHLTINAAGQTKEVNSDIDAANKFQIGIPVGVSYAFGNFVVGANVTIPVTKMYKSDKVPAGAKNFTCMPIYLSVGYRF